MATPPKDQSSPLRQVFNVAERAVATRVEPVVQSGGFASVVSRYIAVNRRVGRTISKVTGGALHLVNIPTTTDVARLHEHLNAVDQQLSQLARKLDNGPVSRQKDTPGRGKGPRTAKDPVDPPMGEED